MSINQTRQNTIHLYFPLPLSLYSLYSLFPRRTEGKHFFVFFPPKGLFSLLDRWLGWVEEHYSCHTQHRSTGHCPLCSPVCWSEIQPDLHLWCHCENWGLWGVQRLDDCTVCVRVCVFVHSDLHHQHLGVSAYASSHCCKDWRGNKPN